VGGYEDFCKAHGSYSHSVVVAEQGGCRAAAARPCPA
jgi:hypothetical protein